LLHACPDASSCHASPDAHAFVTRKAFTESGIASTTPGRFEQEKREEMIQISKYQSHIYLSLYINITI